MMKRNDEGKLIEADIACFVRLLKDKPRTYVDLMAATGVSFRTCKERMRNIRRMHPVQESWLPSECGEGPGRGPVLMWIGEPVVDVVKTACPNHKGSQCMHCKDGSGYIVFTRSEWTARQAERARQRKLLAAAAR